MKQGYTDITVLIDRSGSMMGTEADVIGGFNTFVEKQKEVDGECTLTLIQFATKSEVNYTAKNINEVPPLEYHPTGSSTALRDALGTAITSTGDRLRELDESERPEKVIFVVQTDGQENDSKEFSQGAIQEMVQLQEETYSWDFMFFGADIDAFAAARGLGISSANTIQFTKGAETTNAVFAATAMNVANYRSSGVKSNLNYDESQRKQTVDSTESL